MTNNERLPGVQWLLTVSLEHLATKLTLEKPNFDKDPLDAFEIIGRLAMLKYLIDRYTDTLGAELEDTK